MAGVVVAREWLWTSADRPPGHPVSHAGPAPVPRELRPWVTCTGRAVREPLRATVRPPRGGTVPRPRAARRWRSVRSCRRSRARHAAPSGVDVLGRVPTRARTQRRMRRCQLPRASLGARTKHARSGHRVAPSMGDPASFLARRSDGAVPARARWRPGRTPAAADDCGPPCPWLWQYGQPRGAAQPASRHEFVTVQATATPPAPQGRDPVPGATSLSG
jgi:hypothetical protein